VTDEVVGRRVVAVGTDLVEVDRIRRAVARTPGFAPRVFTDAEQAWAGAARDPAERYAVRWAAKEATLKALGVGLGTVALTDVEVRRHEGGRPELVLHGAAASLAAEQGIGGWLVSLSHTSSLAQAVVLATDGGG
jgi:holo-[acyl-carrier protein] synthase